MKLTILTGAVVALSLLSQGCSTCPPESRRCDGEVAMRCVTPRSDRGDTAGKGVHKIDCASQDNVCHVDGDAMCVAAGLERCKPGDPERCSADGRREMYCNDSGYWSNGANVCDHGCELTEGRARCRQP